MKHSWKIIDKHGKHCVCIRCKCERFTTHSKNYQTHSVSYRPENTTDFVRTAPSCEDKINLKLF